MFANRLRVPTIAPLISLGTVLRNKASMVEAYMAEVMMISEHIRYANPVSGFLICMKLVRTAALVKNASGTVICAPNLSEMCPRAGREMAVPKIAISVIFW